MKARLGVTRALYLKPLLYSLDGRDSPFELTVDLPAQLAIKLRERTEDLRCAFLSPIDYARYGGDYRIVPDIAVSSSARLNVVQLYVKSAVSNISTLAVDPAVTSEIVLAKIILLEKFPNPASSGKQLQFAPMRTDLKSMRAKADAVLVVSHSPELVPAGKDFALDLVEEWKDLTGLPFVHGFWVGREGEIGQDHLSHLIRAKNDGIGHLDDFARALSKDRGIDEKAAMRYLSSFSYALGEEERAGLSEFIRYAFYHGVLQDVPDLNFFEVGSTAPTSRN